ncbi:MAG: TonB-dependent receptor [Bacteroides sp.]
MKGRALIALLYIFFPLCVFAQGKATITGTVTDENNEPIEIVNIRVEKQLVGTVSNLKGHYSLTISSQDEVVLVYSMLGYQTRKKILKNPHGKITLNVVLPNSDYELGEVTITESRRQTGSTAKLDIKGAKLMPDASGGSVESFIATQAGVSSNNELSSQYNVRGGSFDENIVYVNGVEIYRPLLIRSGQQEGLSFINPDMVHEIGFSAGGYEAKYGDKMSSVLDITYKKPQRFEASGAMSLLGASAYVGFSTKHFSMTNGVRFKTNRYLLGTLDTKGEYDPSFVDYQTYLNWSPNKRWEIGFIGNFSQNKYNFKPADRTTKFGTLESVKEFKVYFDGQERDLFRTYFGSLNLTHRFNKYHDVSFLASAFETKEEETYDITGQYWLNALDEPNPDGTPSEDQTVGVGTYMEHARNYLNANVQSYALTGNHQIKSNAIKWGLELKRERIKDKLREWEMRDSAGYSLPHNPETLKLIYNLSSKNKINSSRFSMYVQDTYKFSSKVGLFTLNAGIRGSYWNWNKEFIFSPRASVALIPKFNENFTFRLAAGVYYQAPFYKEFRDTTTINGNAVVTLNKDIKSQRSIHFVLAGDYKFRAMNRPFKFTAEMYYKKLSNLVPYNVDNVRVSYYGYNMADGYAVGLDMKLFGEFVPGTDSWLSFSLMQTKERINGVWIPRPTDQRYSMSFYFSDYFTQNDRWKMNLKATFADGLPFGPPHTGREKAVFRTPSYRRVDIGMSYRLINNEKRESNNKIARCFKNVWLGVDVFNLLDINNVNSYYWVTDVYNQQYAVPNYLTSRQINARLLVEF